ncbi:MAG: YihY/virulence factor BrkB family protein [Betaproteobacteria bacterium]
MKLSAFKPRTLWRLLKSSFTGFSQDNASSMGAALAFYSLLSMAPLIVLVITIAGLFIGRDEAQQLLFTQLAGLLGETGAQGVNVLLQSASSDKEGALQTAISAVVLALGATTVFTELQSDLNRIWKCEAPKSSGLWGLIRTRLLSFGLIAALGFLLLVSLVISAAIAYMGSAWFGSAGEAAGHAMEIVGSIVILTLVFALVFKVLPSRRLPFGDVLMGALVTAILFEIGKFLIGLYIGKSAVASKFGAAGTVIVVIMWVYYSSQIFFFGSEFTRAYSTEHGSRRLDAAANSDYVEHDMVKRAEKIVRGKDPALLQRRT